MGIIYKILNTQTKDFYIGSSKNYKKRIVRHKYQLKIGKHHNPFLQRSWDKYGEDSFIFDILEEVPDTNLLFEREEFWIKQLSPNYNIGSVGGGDNLTNNPNRELIIDKITKAVNKNMKALTKDELSQKFGKRGILNPNWKDGISTRDKLCIDCSVRISNHRKRCVHCCKSGDKNPFFGKKHTPETLAKMADLRRGVYVGNQQKQIEIDGVKYKSCADAARSLGVSNGLITYRIKKYPDRYKVL